MMRSILVSAHNPMTGPRHLGHYLSTMCDWPRLQNDHELFIVIDDLIASILYPRAAKELQDRTLQVAREFAATGIDLEENWIVLTSMVPEAHELALFTSLAIDHHWCNKLYRESFAGLLSSYQRQELRLPRNASLAEFVYPQLHLATLTLGLRADLFQGGEEMRGYLDIMRAMSEGTVGRRAELRPPALLTSKSTFVLGTDGKHMGSENAIYLSASESEIKEAASRVTASATWRQWLTAWDDDVASAKAGSDKSPEEMASTLVTRLAKFRENKTTNHELVEVFERSAVVARERLKETLVRVKASMGIPGFVH